MYFNLIGVFEVITSFPLDHILCHLKAELADNLGTPNEQKLDTFFLPSHKEKM